MKIRHYEEYLSNRYGLEIYKEMEGDVESGSLVDRSTGDCIPIEGGIPRFSDQENYAHNFGLQWNIHRSTQLDSHTGLTISADRLWRGTGWDAGQLRGKRVLEAGSGAGRFTEILAKAGANVITFDYSNAIDANSKNTSSFGDIFYFQGDIYDIPFPDNYFDYVLCYGVLQHTPDPEGAYEAIWSKVVPGGQLAFDFYRRSMFPTPWNSKYLWRPLTSRIDSELLYKIVKAYVPIYLPVHTALLKIPMIGKLLVSLIPIPCFNYVGLGLNRGQRTEWAIMDTFDALSPKYDSPRSREEVIRMIETDDVERYEVKYGGNGIEALVTKKSC